MRACWLALVVVGISLAEVGGALAQSTIDYLPGQSPQDVSLAVKSGNVFAFDLEGRLAQEPGNVFFSPASIDAVLSMLYGGARGETARQMGRTLQFKLRGDTLHVAMGEVLRRINTVPDLPHRKTPPYELVMANALWLQKDLPLTEHFLQVARDDYEADHNQVDFFAPEEARKTINAWAGKETRGRIPEVIPSGGVDTNTRLVVADAVYFKGDWANPFRKEGTQQEPFHLTSQQSAQAPMMHLAARLDYLEQDSLQIVELPYVGGVLSMIVFLPKEVDGLARLEAILAPDSLSEFLNNRKPAQVEVSLPRFQISHDVRLAGVLKEMGIADAFNGNADFTGLSPAKGIFVADIFHKAVISVDETVPVSSTEITAL